MKMPFLEGFASIFNIQGSITTLEQMRARLKRLGIESTDFNDDAQTLANDWGAVAGDIQMAINQEKSPAKLQG